MRPVARSRPFVPAARPSVVVHDGRVRHAPMRVMERLGVTFAYRDVHVLVGMASDGTQRRLGRCGEHRFDWWFPHVGLAVDVDQRPDTEVVCKRGWCSPRGVIYAHRPSEEDWDSLETAVRERQGLRGVQ